jgi:sulfite oxidase
VLRLFPNFIITSVDSTSAHTTKSAPFLAITETPLNGSPTPADLVRSVVTPEESFFVRNHGPIPGDAESGRTREQEGVQISGLVAKPFAFPGSSPSVRPFERTALEVTLQCAGNRRAALHRVRPILNELPWGSEAIGNATWEGVRLSNVLEHAGIADGAAHVWFAGADEAMGKHAGTKFGASIPLEKAMSGDVILADTMNGQPLTPTHGAPIRVVVPGYIGARSVKWLTEIRVEREPSTNVFHAAYSVGDRVLGEFPLSCAFALPQTGAALSAGPLTMRGWAIAGGKHTVARVEVSTDGGASWHDATFTSPARPFVWRLWESHVSLGTGEHQLVCRATDSTGATQPPDAAPLWNAKGYVNNAWDRVTALVAGR